MKIKPASKQDIPWIMEIENAPENRFFLWQGSYEEHCQEIDDPNHYLFVHYSDQEEKVGYSLSQFHQRTNNFELRRIAVKVKGHGFGRQAIQELLRFAFLDLKAQRVWLDVYPHNNVGIKLYKELGFIQEAHLRRSDYQRGEYYDQLVFGMLKEEYVPR